MKPIQFDISKIVLASTRPTSKVGACVDTGSFLAGRPQKSMILSLAHRRLRILPIGMDIHNLVKTTDLEYLQNLR